MLNSELWQVPPAGGGGDFYSHQIAKSFRWDSGYLKWTPSSAGNRQTWTFSCWIKQSGTLTNSQGDMAILNAGTSGDQSSRFRMYYYEQKLRSSSADANYNVSTAVYRDPSAWQHIVWKLTGGTSYQYVNGVEVSTSSVSGDVAINDDVEHVLGIYGGYETATRFKGYMAEVVFIDGTALAPTSFASEKNGVWIPDDVSGLTFGSQGYYLDFANASAPGNDVSGNDNDWTNVSLATHDQTTDTPTFNSDSNGGNFATMNQLTAGTDAPVLAEGNLMIDSFSGSDISGVLSTFALPPSSGKWYFECFINAPNSGDNYPFIGLTADIFGLSASKGVNQRDLSLNLGTGGSEKNDTHVGTITTVFTSVSAYADNTVCGVFVDMDARKLWYAKDGAFFNSGNPQTGANPQYAWTNNVTLLPHFISFGSYGADSVFNFGQEGTFAGNISAGGNADVTGYGNFKYDPGDYKALCSGNLPTADAVDPAQTDDDFPSKLFSPLLYVGNGSDDRNITGVGFAPDWVWIKSRTDAEGHQIYDSTRGVEKRLQSNTTGGEETTSDKFQAFQSDGFQVGSSNDTNKNSSNFVAWNWRANGSTTTTDTSGNIDGVYQTNDCGFSIMKYSGNGNNAQTVPHGVTVGGVATAPSYVIMKNLPDGSNNWRNWSIGYNDGDADSYAEFNDNAWLANQGSGGLFTAKPTSTMLTLTDYSAINASGKAVIVYSFANVEGFIKSGSYVGNANDDGTFLYLGFKPAFFMCKPIVAGNWRIQDNKRAPVNVADETIFPNLSNAEETNSSAEIDLLSNGVKMRASDSNYNQATTFVYLAMAKNPFQYATAR